MSDIVHRSAIMCNIYLYARNGIFTPQLFFVDDLEEEEGGKRKMNEVKRKRRNQNYVVRITLRDKHGLHESQKKQHEAKLPIVVISNTRRLVIGTHKEGRDPSLILVVS